MIEKCLVLLKTKKWAKLTKQKVAKYCNKKLKFALTANIKSQDKCK